MNQTADAIGAISNADILLAAVTIASFALFLPASRDASPLRTTTSGRNGFVVSLLLLFICAALTAISTTAAFAALLAALLSTLVMGAMATLRSPEIEEAVQELSSAIEQRIGRPPIEEAGPPPSGIRCTAFRADGERCRNRIRVGARCGIHGGPG